MKCPQRYLMRVTLIALGVISSIMIVSPKYAHSELVFEDELEQEVKEQKTQNAPEKAKVIEEVAEESEEVSSDDAPSEKPQSRSEMTRRARVREELKNEDLLSEKLEELRLLDEKKRTQQILGASIETPKVVADASTAPVTPAVPVTDVASVKKEELPTAVITTPKEEKIVAPVIEVSSNPVTSVEVSAVAKPETKSEVTLDKEASDESMRFTIAPRGGYSAFTNLNFDFRPQYAAGVGIGVDVSDHFAIHGGYTYATYSMALSNVYTGGFYSFNNNGNSTQLELNDNIFDVGIRANALGLKSKVRPFAGGGVAYRLGYLNYDGVTARNTRAQDIELTGFSGYLEAGLELSLAKHISLVGSGRYFNVLTARRTGATNNYTVLNQNGYYGSANYNTAAVNNHEMTRNQAGDALMQKNFYQIMLGVQVGF